MKRTLTALGMISLLITTALAFSQDKAGDVVQGAFDKAGERPVLEAGGSLTIEPTQSNPDEPVIIKVFSLRNANAADAERLIAQLFPRDIQSIAADQRTNSLIVRGDPETLNIIFAILARLDDQTQSDSASPLQGAGKGKTSQTPPVGELTRQYQAKEKQATDLARQIRELQSAEGAHKPRIDELSARLRRAVADAFAARQQLHRAEAAQLQQRIAAIQDNLQTRQKLSDQIIDRRVKDLLNPIWAGRQPQTAAPPRRQPRQRRRPASFRRANGRLSSPQTASSPSMPKSSRPRPSWLLSPPAHSRT
jgi:type II secretory pathway component GspD/PulD (secretin)